MYRIDFDLSQQNTQWSSQINQLNSDILKRHIHPRITTNNSAIHFSFCDKSNQGDILTNEGTKLGTFKIY